MKIHISTILPYSSSFSEILTTCNAISSRRQSSLLVILTTYSVSWSRIRLPLRQKSDNLSLCWRMDKRHHHVSYLNFSKSDDMWPCPCFEHFWIHVRFREHFRIAIEMVQRPAYSPIRTDEWLVIFMFSAVCRLGSIPVNDHLPLIGHKISTDLNSIRLLSQVVKYYILDLIKNQSTLYDHAFQVQCKMIPYWIRAVCIVRAEHMWSQGFLRFIFATYDLNLEAIPPLVLYKLSRLCV